MSSRLTHSFCHYKQQNFFLFMSENDYIIISKISFFSYLPMVTWTISVSWLLWTMLWWTQAYRHFFKLLILASSNICPEALLLNLVVVLLLSFWGQYIVFFTMTLPMTFSLVLYISKHFPQVLASTSYCLSFDNSHETHRIHNHLSLETQSIHNQHGGLNE